MNKIINHKKDMVNIFIERLLRSKVREDIAKVFLFGSVLKGEADENSDIDLLIISLNGKASVEKTCLDISFELLNRSGEFIEPHIYTIYDWKGVPLDYLVYNASKKGKEVYTMNEEEIKRREIQGFLDLSAEYLESAKILFDKRHFRGAIDQAYNALELCMKGFILFCLSDIPGRHSAVIGKFIEHYLKPETLPRTLSKRIKHAFQKRNDARYRPLADLNQEDAEELIDLSHTLFQRLEEKLKETAD